MKGQGYFISPKGDFINIDDTHINSIINYPEKFNLNRNYIDSVYKKYGETVGQEGEAREEIIKNIIEKGWIRVREYANQYWSLQLYRLNKRKEELIFRLAVNIKDKKLSRYGSLFDEVKITDIYNDKLYAVTVNDIISGNFFSKHFESKQNYDINIITIKEYKNIDYLFLKLTEEQKKYLKTRENYIKVFHETSLTRIRTKMENSDTGTITGFRSEFNKKDNLLRNKSLLSKLQSLGYGVTSVKGSYIENYGTPDEKEVGENVFFVEDMGNKGNLKKDLERLGLEFDQDSILFIPKGEFVGYLVGTSKRGNSYPGYKKEIKLNNPLFGKTGEFMTRVKGRPFIFESVNKEIENPTGYMGKWACKETAKKHWKDLA